MCYVLILPPRPGARGQRREGTSIEPIIGRNASSARNRLASRDLLRLRALSGFGTGGGRGRPLCLLSGERADFQALSRN